MKIVTAVNSYGVPQIRVPEIVVPVNSHGGPQVQVPEIVIAVNSYGNPQIGVPEKKTLWHLMQGTNVAISAAEGTATATVAVFMMVRRP